MQPDRDTPTRPNAAQAEAEGRPTCALPAPRLQLRWTLPAEDDPDWSFAPNRPGSDGYRCWICHYELVLPLREYDIRREREDGPGVTELVIPISKTRRGSTQPPDDEPFRDGAHASLDAAHLGDPPVYLIPFTGSPALLDDLRAERQAARPSGPEAGGRGRG